MPMSRASAHGVLFAGLLLVSTAGPFLVMARMDAFAVVLYRMAFAGALFLGWALLRRELQLTRRQAARIAVGGAFLALHFMLWIKAFDLTDYASNLLLLVTEPVVAAIFGIWLGERPTRATWTSVALAALGLAIVAGHDFRLGPRALLGDGLCILAGVAITLFFVITQRERETLPLSSFMGVALLAGALVSVPVVLLAHAPLLAYPRESWGWLAGIVLLTTLGGHGAFNLAARQVRLFTVNLVVVLEPAIAIAMGALLFGATVTPLQVAGGVVLAMAVVVGLRAPTTARVQVQPSE